MLGDSSKQSRFFRAIGPGLFICYCCVAATAAVEPDDSLSNLKRQFVETFLKAEQGDPQSQYDVGMEYYGGQQVPQDSGLAAMWFTRAAEQGHPQAQFFLSLMYGLGDGIPQSDAKAAKWCRTAAEQGHSEAQYSLGRMYATGQGLQQDDALALGWFTLSAEQGHADSQCELGLFYRRGRGTNPDTNLAIQWWLKAVQQGHAWSGLLLEEAMAQQEAPVVVADAANEQAEQFMDILAEDLGLLDPSQSVAVQYEVSPAPQDPVDQIEDFDDTDSRQVAQKVSSAAIESVQLETTEPEPDLNVTVLEPSPSEGAIRERAPQDDENESIPSFDSKPHHADDPVAQYDLALKYYEGGQADQDYVKAAECFAAAAAQDHALAQYKLGVMYSFGQGVSQNSAEAVKWFRRAAEQGLPSAQYGLAVMYATGQGVAPDPVEAAQWYTRAAEQGSVAAQYMLGVIYSKGQGVARDPRESIFWYTKAAEQGSPAAQYLLGLLYENGQGVVLEDQQESVKWYTEAALRGHGDAQYNLVVMYATGQGVEKDYIKAYMWCLIANLNGKNVTRYEQQLEKRMTTEQLEQARRLAREFLEKNVQVPLYGPGASAEAANNLNPKSNSLP